MKEKPFTITRVFIFLMLVGFLVVIPAGASALWPAPTAVEKQVLNPLRTPVKPKLDGVLDDKTWQSAPLEKDFISYSPHYGEVLPFKTHIWMAYDNKNLYFAFRCYDPEPQKIKTSLAKRDTIINDDWVGFSLDALGTKQTAYGLIVNPYGIQADLLDSAVSGEDRSPDFVWKSAAKLTAEGYEVEIAVPLNSISFKAGKEVKMGVLFWRCISRLGIIGSWPHSKPGQGVFKTHTSLIYKNLKTPLKLELLPSITHSSNRERKDSQEWNERETFTGFGIGLKYGITSSLTGEITINPDFSQVESDAFQVEVNQRYPLFYSEKRPFFMEGADIFDFFTAPYGFLPNAAHTRRIVDPNWGVKLTGTVDKITFGLLFSGDKWPGQTWQSEINPNEGKKALFGIARGKYSLDQDNYIGFLYSGREFSGEYNRVLGTDFGYRLSKHQKINTSFLFSMSGNDNLNTGNNNFLKKLDFNLLYSYITKSLRIKAAFEHIGADFRMDSAYILRTGIDEGWTLLLYNFYPGPQKHHWLKRITPRFLYQYVHDTNTDMNDGILNPGLDIFTRWGYLGLNYISIKESWEGQTFDLDQFNLYGSFQVNRWLSFYFSFTSGEKIYYDIPSYKGTGSDGDLTLVFQPNKNLNQQFSIFHSDLSNDVEKVFDVNIYYSRTTYQFNKYFFLRGVIQYDSYQKRILTDLLASLTLIPGTVLHVGYGGLSESRKWQDNQWLYRQGNMLNIKRSFFLKASYLWRF